MKKRSVRTMTIALSLSVLLSSAVWAADMPPGGFGGGGNVPPPPPGGGSMTFYTGDAVTDLESGDYTGQVFPDSTGETEVALRVGPGVTATLKDSTVTKTAGDMTGDDGSFYGVNSGVLAYSEDASTPAELTINGGKVETSASGANGVFAYGSSTINLEDATVTTTGEGGSGGALALAVADRVLMLENALYSVISPRGCASILWKDPTREAEAADTLHITAQDLYSFGMIEGIIQEGSSNAQLMRNVARTLRDQLAELSAEPSIEVMLEKRYEKFRKIGVFRTINQDQNEGV